MYVENTADTLEWPQDAQMLANYMKKKTQEDQGKKEDKSWGLTLSLPPIILAGNQPTRRAHFYAKRLEVGWNHTHD